MCIQFTANVTGQEILMLNLYSRVTSNQTQYCQYPHIVAEVQNYMQHCSDYHKFRCVSINSEIKQSSFKIMIFIHYLSKCFTDPTKMHTFAALTNLVCYIRADVNPGLSRIQPEYPNCSFFTLGKHIKFYIVNIISNNQKVLLSCYSFL